MYIYVYKCIYIYVYLYVLFDSCTLPYLVSYVSCPVKYPMSAALCGVLYGVTFGARQLIRISSHKAWFLSWPKVWLSALRVKQLEGTPEQWAEGATDDLHLITSGAEMTRRQVA